MKKHFYLLLVFVLIAVTSQAQEIPPSEVTLFKNVNIFDGENEKLLASPSRKKISHLS